VAFASTAILGSERHYSLGGGIETKFTVLKVPRQCPLVLPVEATLVCGICSILIFKEVGAKFNLTLRGLYQGEILKS
jgi:hypothetical protein